MSLSRVLVGGFVGTLVLTTVLAAASELRLTRIDLPFLLGTALSANRTRARVVGFAVHFLFGLVFAVVYWEIFLALGRAGWAPGLVMAVGHELFASTTLVNIVLPTIHPRMGTSFSVAHEAPSLEPPGFLMLNYGRSSPIVAMFAHAADGTIVGTFAGFKN